MVKNGFGDLLGRCCWFWGVDTLWLFLCSKAGCSGVGRYCFGIRFFLIYGLGAIDALLVFNGKSGLLVRVYEHWNGAGKLFILDEYTYSLIEPQEYTIPILAEGS